MKEWILGPINNEQMHSAFTADSAKRFWLVWLLEAYFRGFPPSVSSFDVGRKKGPKRVGKKGE